MRIGCATWHAGIRCCFVALRVGIGYKGSLVSLGGSDDTVWPGLLGSHRVESAGSGGARAFTNM